jgi:predicted aspartyl protease
MRVPLVPVTLILFTLLPVVGVAGPATTPFDLLDDGSIVVAVTIGGTGPYRFVVDTGSSRTLISTRLWKTLRLPVLAKTRMVTPAGEDEAYVVRLGGLAMPGRSEVTVAAAVVKADRYAAGQEVDGLIGQDVLAAAIYTIDYEQREIVWHSAQDVLGGVRLPIDVRDRRVLVQLPQYPGDPRPLSLIPDSGSDSLVLFAHARQKVRLTPLEVGVLTGVSGSRLVHRVQLDDLVVGQARLENPLAVIVDGGETTGLMGDGLLPLHRFARVTFNVAGGFLMVQ